MGYVWKKPLQAEIDWSGMLEGESFLSSLRNVGGTTVMHMVCRKGSVTQRRLACLVDGDASGELKDLLFYSTPWHHHHACLQHDLDHFAPSPLNALPRIATLTSHTQNIFR